MRKSIASEYADLNYEDILSVHFKEKIFTIHNNEIDLILMNDGSILEVNNLKELLFFKETKKPLKISIFSKAHSNRYNSYSLRIDVLKDNELIIITKENIITINSLKNKQTKYFYKYFNDLGLNIDLILSKLAEKNKLPLSLKDRMNLKFRKKKLIDIYN